MRPTLPLDKMTTVEKLQTIEEIWSDLQNQPDQVPYDTADWKPLHDPYGEYPAGRLMTRLVQAMDIVAPVRLPA